jgi:hypothetical protein
MRTPTEYNYDDRNLLLRTCFEKNKKPSCLGLLVSPSFLKFSQLHFPFSSHAFDDVEDKKKPRECGSTTNNRQAGKE